LADVLRKNGRLYPVTMTTGESYFYYECTSIIDSISLKHSSIRSGAFVKSIDINKEMVLPEIFVDKKWIGLNVDDRFKQTAE